MVFTEEDKAFIKILPRDTMLSAVYATPIPSVCPSACHMRGLYQNG